MLTSLLATSDLALPVAFRRALAESKFILGPPAAFGPAAFLHSQQPADIHLEGFGQPPKFKIKNTALIVFNLGYGNAI